MFRSIKFQCNVTKSFFCFIQLIEISCLELKSQNLENANLPMIYTDLSDNTEIVFQLLAIKIEKQFEEEKSTIDSTIFYYQYCTEM